MAGMSLMFVHASTALTWVLVLRTLPVRLIDVTILGIVVGILLLDWNDSALPGASRAWPIVVLCVDQMNGFFKDVLIRNVRP